MKNRFYIRFAFTGALIASVFCAYSQQSILRSGDWFKFSVEKRGIYKIDIGLLRKAGVDVSTINPKKLRLYGQGGGMLAQSNAATRPDDLVENAIFVSGEGDGQFNNDDHILFFAEGPDEVRYETNRGTFFYEHNLYADKNFYYLTISDEDGKRISQHENVAGNFPLVKTFDDFIFHEVDEHNALTSGREWFGELFDITTERIFTFDVPGIEPGSELTWVSDVMAQTTNPQGSSFKLFLNNVEIGQQFVAPISTYIYSDRGKQNADTLLFNGSTLGASAQEVKYQYVKAGTGRSTGYLDFFLISFTRKLSLYGAQTIFRSTASLQQPTSTFQIDQVGSGTSIWNIANPNEPAAQSFSTSSGTATFSTSSTALQEFVVFNANIPAPAFIEKLENQNLRGIATPSLLIITHPDFQEEADRLAAHRQDFSTISVAVVSVFDIYNEFSSGRQDVTAIRDYIRYLYNKDAGQLKSVLMMGRGSYDYKDRVKNNTNFVPAYESRNSLHPLQTYASDDFFGFMESSEGEWQEEPAVNHSMDVGIGRLPVKSVEEARQVVDKLIDYDINKKNFGRWRKEITFVADDGNNDDNYSTIHQSQANTLAEFIESEYPEFDTKKIFIGMHPKEIKPSGETAKSANEAIVKAFEKGTVIINFTGHGSERVWTDEKVLTDLTIPELTNKMYPFMITATCEFGRQDDPAQISTAELCLLQKNSGAIGLVSTSRPVNSSTNFELNEAFYNALFQKENNRYLPVGEVFLRTKNNSTSGVSNRNFSLLGDPSLRLAFPQQHVVVTAIETESNSTSLKALSKVSVRGEVQDEDGTLITSYNGSLEATLFDKKTQFKTIGKNLFTFEQWYNALFRGKATVLDGTFELEFIMPKNIAYELGQGKLSLYASDPENFVDAGGADLDFTIGESEVNPISDNTSPDIQLFMGDTTFINGGVTNPDTYLVAKLHDTNGINISSYGIGNDIMAILDDTQTFILNDYYVASQDDYASGYIYYPMTGLSPGKHVITLKAWDTHNNPGEAHIEFIVTEGEGIVIESFGNFPNPAEAATTFYFTHNRSGDDVQATVYLFNTAGMIQQTFEITIAESSYRVEFPQIDLKNSPVKNLAPGLYLARLVLRSLTNTSKSERVTKLIVLN